MEESVRLAYLAAMDIPVWLLRGREEAVTVAESSLPAAVVAPTRPAARNVRDVLGASTPPRAAPVVTARTPRAAQTRSTDQTAMALTFVAAGAFLFIDEATPQSLQQSCADLLAAIAFALGGVRVGAMLHPFDWPPHGTRVDSAQFRDGVMGRLAKLNQSGDFQRLILMGAAPASLLLEWTATQFSARTAEAQHIAGIAVPAFVTHASADLLADAQLKREAWRDLRPALLG